MRIAIALAAIIAGSLLTAPERAAAAQQDCTSPEDAAGVVVPLTHLADVLKPGATLSVLAVGSASVFGPEANLKVEPGPIKASIDAPHADASSQSLSPAAFPLQMAQRLQASIPGLHVVIDVRGGRGISADEQLHLIEAGLHGHAYQLVLWQTGTVEAVRNLPPSEFASTLADGAGITEQNGADLVLIDPQFSRFLQTNSNIEPYEAAFQQVSSLPGVLYFRRFELMRAWVNAGQIDLERTPKADRRRTVEQLHACLGQLLASLVLQGAKQPP